MSIVHKKVMLLGDIGVGKSSVARRMAFNTFDSSYKTTIGVDLFNCDVPLGADGVMRLSIWDTDGDFGLGIFESVYVRGASGALVIADVTRPQTLAKLKRLVPTFQDRLPGRPVMALLNKTDLATPDEVAELRDQLDRRGDGVHLTSALLGDGITDAFASCAHLMVRRGV